jgi:hypothetical protein
MNPDHESQGSQVHSIRLSHSRNSMCCFDQSRTGTCVGTFYTLQLFNDIQFPGWRRGFFLEDGLWGSWPLDTTAQDSKVAHTSRAGKDQ